MSDKILRALMQLFAIIANAERLTEQGRIIVETFLRQQLSQGLVKTYLAVFDEYLTMLQGKSDPDKVKKRVSVNSVKVLRICTEINAELDHKQKYVVLIRLIEFAYSSNEAITDQEAEFLSTVAGVFNISTPDFEAALALAGSHDVSTGMDSGTFLLVSNSLATELKHVRHMVNETLEGEIWILHLKSAGILFARYHGSGQITLNGHPLPNDAVHVLSPGSVIRGIKMEPVYYSDVIRSFMDDVLQSEVLLTVQNVEYLFRNGKQGLHDISFSATSGNLVGIMGGSGAGKSTLLNILNSNFCPTKGEVHINGINIHTENKKLEGVIGYVPQDDLLMEDLSVFQNLYFNSKLCLGDISDEEVKAKVDQLLQTLGLYESRNLKVGDPLHTTISGGQRKRLNIALELIRKPAVLFVDEPTSGLSSLDSENVMDLLKQLSINGHLVFVVIHQPSSDIFKMFDKLLLLDTGGYPVYFGNPTDSLTYFKNKASYADADVSECETCGNITPDLVFNIIESKVLDEFGNPTPVRKFSPQDWNHHYKDHISNTDEAVNFRKDVDTAEFKKPSRWKQISVFMQRDVLSKLRNTQYLLINFLEAPLLAVILSYFLKYYNEETGYVFRLNINLPAYIFMSVLVALFMGLTVSGEEIIRDRKILKREAFLNLSRSSYLLSKIAVLFLISAIQTASFVIAGNLIFGIHDMFFSYWIILFSASCFSNMLGLNISDSLDSVITVYILIPFLLIPQIILSGVIVKFEHLHPKVTVQNKVPLIGEMMVSRWAFEAIAVNQFKNNRYEKLFFKQEKIMSHATYQKDFWLMRMNDKLDSLYGGKFGNKAHGEIVLLKNEIMKSEYNGIGAAPVLHSGRSSESVSEADYRNLKSYLADLKKYYIHLYNAAAHSKDSIVATLTMNGGDQLLKLKDEYTNESLSDLVLDMNNFEVLIEKNHSFIQRFRPVFMDGSKHSIIRAPLFVSSKNVFGKYHDTWLVNLCVIWLMSVVLMVTLYFSVLKRMIKGIGNIVSRR